MQQPEKNSVYIGYWCRPACVALCALSVPLFWSVSCAQGVDSGGDDGGTSDDSTGAADNPALPMQDATRPPYSQDAGNGQDTASPGIDSATDAPDESLMADEGGGAETAAPEAGDGSTGGGSDGSADAHDSAIPEVGADSGHDASQDAPAIDSGTALRVFVSSKTYDGNLGGALGADGICNTLATQAGLGGTWMAWISDATTSPSQRFTKATVPYRRLDGVAVASSWADLTTGISNAIDVDETNASHAADSSNASKTWTGTTVAGVLSTSSCGNFASNSSTTTGQVGHCTGTGTVNWTSAYATETCSVPNHVYCFEQ
jgi:hypothetical protein